jgi:predicted nucleic acid-binding protein
MLAESFLDTNVLVYAALPGDDEAWKQKIAVDLLQNERFAVSSQVMLEFFNVTTRKRKPALDVSIARDWLSDFRSAPVIAVDDEIVMEGIELAQRHKIVFWDGVIVAAAQRAGAKTLYTEDLNDGQRYGSVTAVNPFKQQAN